jgi:hypothetical protein
VFWPRCAPLHSAHLSFWAGLASISLSYQLCCKHSFLYFLNLVDFYSASGRDFQQLIKQFSSPVFRKKTLTYFALFFYRANPLNGYVVFKSQTINSLPPYFLATLIRGHIYNDDVTVVLLPSLLFPSRSSVVYKSAVVKLIVPDWGIKSTMA